MNARRRRRDFLRPLVEVLEPRALLACEVLFDRGVLTVLGDAADDTIEVILDGQGFHVTCDGQRSGPFTHVQSIQVHPGSGKNNMAFDADEALGASALADANGGSLPEIVDFWGGTLADTFEVQASPAQRLVLHGEGGADRFDIRFGRLFGDVRVEDEGSRGEDLLVVHGNSFTEKIEIVPRGLEQRQDLIAKWAGPDLKGTGNEVSIESIEIAHEGIELVRAESHGGDDELAAGLPVPAWVDLELSGREGAAPGSHRLFRLFSLIDTPDDAARISPRGRTPGTININSVLEATDELLVVGGGISETFQLAPGPSADAFATTILGPNNLPIASVTAEAVATVTVKAGGGNDQFDVADSLAVTANLFGQLGNDAVFLSPFPNSPFVLPGASSTAFDGGEGDDRAGVLTTDAAELIEVLGLAAAEVPDPLIRVTHLASGQVRSETSIFAAEHVSIDAGGGDDDVIMTDELGLLGGIDWSIDLGEGHNLFQADLVNPHGQLAVFAGSGNDRLTANAVWDDQVGGDHPDFIWLPTYNPGAGNDQALITVFTRTGNIASFPVDTALDLGDGDDLAEILIAPGVPLDRFGALIDTGAGSDAVKVEVAPALTELAVVVYAGRGDDTVDMEMTAVPDSLQVLAGEGNDDVSIIFADSPNNPVPPRDPIDPPPEIIVDAGAGVDSVMIDVYSTLVQPPADDSADVIGQITLTEVLAAIHVSGVGLLALLTLFPLGALEMSQSIQDDRAGHAKTDATIAIDGAHLEIDLATGSTADRVLVDLAPVPGSRVDLDLDTGRGDDELEVRSTSPAGPLDWTLAVVPGGDDDQVLVGFEHGDVDQPIIIGALWNPADSPPGSRPDSTARLAMRAAADPQKSRFDLDFDLVGTAARDEVSLDVDVPAESETIFYVLDCSGSMGPGDDDVAVALTSAAASTEQKVRVDGGSGADGITVMLRRLANPHLPQGTDQTDQTELDLRGGAGNDALSVALETVADVAMQKVRIDGGDGDDEVSVSAPEAGGDGLADIIVGAGPGAGPHVKAFDGGSLAEAKSFFAYDAGFAGGVRVAAGDVNGDGVSDIITGAGPGAGPHVKVFDGRTHAELASFFAYAPGFPGGVYVAAADVNRDGRDDIITGAGTGAPGGHVKVFDGRTGAEVRSFEAFPGFLGGVSVAGGDVNGDGASDIIVATGQGSPNSGAPGGHVKVFDGQTGQLLMSFLAFDGFQGGVNVGAGDVTGDGLADIITGAGAGAPGGHVKVFDGRTGAEVRSFEAFPGFLGGVSVAGGDVNSDGRDDIVVGAGPGAAGGHVKVFDSLTGSELASFFAFDPNFAGGVFVAAGDLNASAVPDSLTFELDVDTGRGEDRVLTDVVSFEVRLLRQSVQIDTGEGDDFTRTRLLGPLEFLDDIDFPRDSESDLSLDMGDGNDRAEAELQPTARAGKYSFAYLLRMGRGNDVARYWVFGTELPPSPNEPPVSRLDFVVEGGADNDDIQGRVGVARDGEHLPLLLTDVLVSVDGGTGRDRLSLDWRGAILEPAAVDVVLRGGGGNDQVRARFDIDPASTGRLSAQVLGEDGSDELGLAVLGADELAVLLALVDGGAGKDRCQTTANVRVLNCP